MNSLSGRFGILAAAICGLALAACNAVQDAHDAPAIANPPQKVVLGGTITGLGTRRPITLQYNGQDTCIQPKDINNPSGDQIVGECKFFGVLNKPSTDFSFGALQVGTPYNITVKTQPFGRICTVSNGVGTVGPGTAAIVVNCATDPAIAHYSVTVAVLPAASAKAGLKLTLTTEDGAWDIPVTPSTSTQNYTFSEATNTGYVFNSLASPPVMGWRVTATIPGATLTDPPTNCLVSGGPVTNTGGNIDDTLTPPAATAAPTGNVTGVQVLSCGFQVRAQAEYSLPTGVTVTPTIASGDGITLLLRQQPSGVDVASVKLTSFAATFVPFADLDAQGNPTANAHEVTSDVNAFYEVVVKSSPAGMACMPGYTTTTGRGTSAVTDAGAVLLIKPASARVSGTWIIDRIIRCRNLPATGKALRGVYQQTATTTTKTTSVTPATSTTLTSTAANRNYLALFEDGTYLYGAHASSALTSGVEQGFYDYDNVGQKLVFTAYTDTSTSGGLHNSSATSTPVVTLTSVVKSSATNPNVITAHASTTIVTGLVLAAGNLTVSVNGATAANVAAATYTTPATLATAINTAAGSTIAVANSGNEIQITGPTGGVVIAGASAAGLGFGAVAAGATATSTGVAKATSTTVQTDGDWRFTEVGPDTSDSTPTALDGAWVTWDTKRVVEDRRRVFTYQHGKYQAVHIGVNGIGNMQDACYVSDSGLTGEWVRQGARSGCSLPVVTVRSDLAAPTSTGLASLDVPNPTTTPALTTGFQGKWPQSTDPSYTDGRPYSPVDFEVRPAGSVPADPICPTVDKLTVWDTKNGTRLDQLTPPVPPIVLCRITAN